MDDELYRELILEHYKHPHNAGQLEGALAHKELNPSCGDAIEMFVLLDDCDCVKDVKFTGTGCAISQASASLLTDKIKGRPLAELMALNQDDVFRMLEVPINPGRIRCALLSLKTLHKAIEKKNL